MLYMHIFLKWNDKNCAWSRVKSKNSRPKYEMMNVLGYLCVCVFVCADGRTLLMLSFMMIAYR